jgi:hypothetical protein
MNASGNQPSSALVLANLRALAILAERPLAA